jgi:hypothetical protein
MTHNHTYIVRRDRGIRISEILNDCVQLCVPASRNESLGSILQKICAKIVANQAALTTSITALQEQVAAFTPPKMTTAQKNAILSPISGMIIYDTTLNKLCVYTTAWETITSA